MLKKIIILSIMALGFSGQCKEFYSLDFENDKIGASWIGKDVNGKRIGCSVKCGQWPRPKGKVVARISSGSVAGGGKSLELIPGFTIYSWNWTRDSHDATQSNIWGSFNIYVPAPAKNGVIAGIKLVQKANICGAYISVIYSNGKLYIAASNGDGKGYIKWDKIADIKPDNWVNVTIESHFKEKKYDVSINGKEPVKGLIFRHAEKWKGTMWPESLKRPENRYELESSISGVKFDSIIFSSTQINNGQEK